MSGAWVTLRPHYGQVAEKYNVQMACHLDDPPAPVLKGVERWDWPVFEGLQRMAALADHSRGRCCHRAFVSRADVQSCAKPGLRASRRMIANDSRGSRMKDGAGLAIAQVDSPCHGFNLCCGTAAEGLDDPGTDSQHRPWGHSRAA